MADNVAITAGSGTSIATDDCGASGHAQRVKLSVAGDGDATPLPATATDGLLVNLGANNDVTVSGTVAVSGTVPVTDNSGTLTVDAPVGTPVFVRLSDGASPIATLPVSVASVPSHAVTNAGTFATQATLQAGEAHVGLVHGTTADVAVTVTRPADTTAYAANDSVNTSTSSPTIITFAGASRVASGTGYITKARLSTNQSANVAQFRMYLFKVSNPQLSNDNAAFLIKDADNANRLGYIDFPACFTEAGSDVAIAVLDGLRFGYVADSGSALYGILLTKTAFTPISGQTFHLVLTCEQN